MKAKEIDVWINYENNEALNKMLGQEPENRGGMSSGVNISFRKNINFPLSFKTTAIVQAPEKKIEISESDFRDAMNRVHSDWKDEDLMYHINELKKELGF